VLGTVAVGAGPETLAVAAHEGRIFIVNGAGNTVSVLDAHTGTLLRTVSVGKAGWDRPQSFGGENPVDVVVDQRRGRVYVIDGTPVAGKGTDVRGSVSMLDARSGQVLRTITVGRAPVGLAMDESTAELFVVNGGSADPSSKQTWWGWIPRACDAGCRGCRRHRHQPLTAA
jgi:YVTN family beta-propeller protein